MKTASIVSIGNEILSGLTVDTNAAYLSKQLMSIGLATASSYTVGDDISKIARAIERAACDSDIILITGGLGPTDDDITRDALADYLQVELVFVPELLEQIQAYFQKRDRDMASTNRVQAYLPQGTQALKNTVGTAPSIWAEKDGKIFVAMPGVPMEMKQVFEDFVFPRIESIAEAMADRKVVISRKLKCFGTGESNIAEMIGDIMRRDRNPLINCTVHEAVITLHIIATAGDKAHAEAMIEKDAKKLKKILGQLVYGTDDQTLAEVVGHELAKRGLTLATAESCTGGLIGKMITDIPGASEYFKAGWITYTNEAKNSELGVDLSLIEEHGAVSGQVAAAMANQARIRSGANIGIGVTGIAGPDGETAEKPVGLVYIGVSFADIGGVRSGQTEVIRKVFSHSRGYIRRCAALTALNVIRIGL
jgi:nicotinamide-nucleotide amidase